MEKEPHLYHRECWNNHDHPILMEILQSQSILVLELIVKDPTIHIQLKKELTKTLRKFLDKRKYNKKWSFFMWFKIRKGGIL